MIIQTQLNDGTPVCIRTVCKDDEQRLIDGIAKLSTKSRYLRFFSGMREPPRHVIDALTEVDGHNHIAWGAIATDEPEQPALGIVHAFRADTDPAMAEFSVAVIDEYQGRGVARLLSTVLLLDCKEEGFEKLTVHILHENKPAILLAKSLGADQVRMESGVTVCDIEIERALASLREIEDVPGIKDVFEAFGYPKA